MGEFSKVKPFSQQFYITLAPDLADYAHDGLFDKGFFAVHQNDKIPVIGKPNHADIDSKHAVSSLCRYYNSESDKFYRLVSFDKWSELFEERSTCRQVVKSWQ